MAARPWLSRWARERLGRGQQRLGGDDDPVGLVRGAAEGDSGSGPDLGGEEGLGGDGEVAVVLLGVPGEAAVGEGAGEEAGHGGGDVEEEGAGSGARG